MFGLFSKKAQQGPRAMNYRQIDENIAVTGQITEADVAAIAQAGFKSVVCNRPDEEQGAVPHQAIEKAAAAAGLEFRFIPVGGFGMTPVNVDEMAKAVRDLPKPMLAYCRSGARSANLYMTAARMR